MEAMEVAGAQHDDTRRISERPRTEAAVHHPRGIAPETGQRRCIDGILRGRRRKIDRVLHGGRHGKGSGPVFHRRRCRALPCESELFLELSQPRPHRLHFGLARPIACSLLARAGLRCAGVNDLGHVGALGRSDVAHVEPSRRIDPGVGVGVGGLQPERTGENGGQYCAKETHDHDRRPVTIAPPL